MLELNSVCAQLCHRRSIVPQHGIWMEEPGLIFNLCVSVRGPELARPCSRCAHGIQHHVHGCRTPPRAAFASPPSPPLPSSPPPPACPAAQSSYPPSPTSSSSYCRTVVSCCWAAGWLLQRGHRGLPVPARRPQPAHGAQRPPGAGHGAGAGQGGRALHRGGGSEGLEG